MLVLGSCGGVPEQVDKKGEPSAQTKPLGGSVDKGAKDVSKTTIFETPVEGKKDISKLVEGILFGILRHAAGFFNFSKIAKSYKNLSFFCFNHKLIACFWKHFLFYT